MSMILKRVLVTGATGFIGGRLVRRLLDCQCQVSCLVRPNSAVDELRQGARGITLIAGDVTDPQSVDRAVAQAHADTVFHLAGLVRALRWGGRGDFTRVNAEGVESVAAACAQRASPPVLVVVSSLSAAGPAAEGRVRTEVDGPEPVSEYGRSKLAGEQAAARYAGAVPISILRPPIVFGPGDRGVLEIFRPIARRRFHLVPGGEGVSCGRRFSFVYVDDLVEGLLRTALRGERLVVSGALGQGVYFVAGVEQPTYAQFGQAIAAALGQQSPFVMRVPAPLLRLVGVCGDAAAYVRRRPGWLSSDKITEALAGSWTCSAAKARSQLGWSPAATLAVRLHETAQWYRQAGWL